MRKEGATDVELLPEGGEEERFLLEESGRETSFCNGDQLDLIRKEREGEG